MKRIAKRFLAILFILPPKPIDLTKFKKLTNLNLIHKIINNLILIKQRIQHINIYIYICITNHHLYVT